jgi:hypothetical protein
MTIRRVPERPLTPREQRRYARELQRRLEDLDRLDAAYGLGALPRATARRGLSFTTAMAIAITGVLVTLMVLLLPSGPMESVRRTLRLGSERALPAPPIEDRGGVFAFTMTQQGSDEPVGWDPCEPIRYQVNPTDEPDGGRQLIERALARASAATGLTFEDDGTTDKRPFTAQFVPLGTDRPVVIGWATAAEFPELAGDIAGLGGGAAEEEGLGRRYYVTGGVVLDTDIFTAAEIAVRQPTMEAIVLHEVAHVIGLNHVNEPTELMAATNSGQIDLGPGDREGLARLGSLPCA